MNDSWQSNVWRLSYGGFFPRARTLFEPFVASEIVVASQLVFAQKVAKGLVSNLLKTELRKQLCRACMS